MMQLYPHRVPSTSVKTQDDTCKWIALIESARRSIVKISLRLSIYVWGILQIAVAAGQPLALPSRPCDAMAFKETIGRVKDAIQRNNRVLALELLAEATSCLDQLEDRPLLDEEALRWDIAQINLERADSVADRIAASAFANESLIRWREYIEWYQNLTDEARAYLRRHPRSHRIDRAVRQLGLAIVRRANVDGYSVADLFSEYADLPENYHTTNTVRLWRLWLFRCPSWDEPKNLSHQSLRQRFSTTQEACQEHWMAFSEFLEVWVEVASLNPTNKRTFERWTQELKDVLSS